MVGSTPTGGTSVRFHAAKANGPQMSPRFTDGPERREVPGVGRNTPGAIICRRGVVEAPLPSKQKGPVRVPVGGSRPLKVADACGACDRLGAAANRWDFVCRRCRLIRRPAAYTGPWPRGKARDFDSRIGGSNPSGSASVRFHAAKANGLPVHLIRRLRAPPSPRGEGQVGGKWKMAPLPSLAAV